LNGCHYLKTLSEDVMCDIYNGIFDEAI
jgi:hypothetical protein